jgi:hypothetical protein
MTKRRLCGALLGTLLLALVLGGPGSTAAPGTPEEAIWQDAERFLAGQCDQQGGRIGSHISTANVARDLDALRQVVGPPCSRADDAVDNYLPTSVPPPSGTTCNQDFTPFAD